MTCLNIKTVAEHPDIALLKESHQLDLGLGFNKVPVPELQMSLFSLFGTSPVAMLQSQTRRGRALLQFNRIQGCPVRLELVVVEYGHRGHLVAHLETQLPGERSDAAFGSNQIAAIEIFLSALVIEQGEIIQDIIKGAVIPLRIVRIVGEICRTIHPFHEIVAAFIYK